MHARLGLGQACARARAEATRHADEHAPNKEHGGNMGRMHQAGAHTCTVGRSTAPLATVTKKGSSSSAAEWKRGSLEFAL